MGNTETEENEFLISMSRMIIYVYPMISFVGFVTNILSFIVFSRKKFKKTIFSIYFRFLIIFDTLALLVPINKFLELNLAIVISHSSNLLCKTRMYYEFVITPISSWILVFISLDRFLGIAYPFNFKMHKKSKFQIIVCFGILFFHLAYFAPNLSYNLTHKKHITNDTNETMLIISCNNPNVPLNTMVFFQSDLIPFVLMVVLTSITLLKLFESRKRLQNNLSRHKDVKFAIISVTLNVIFLILTGPHYIFNLLYENYLDTISFDLFISIVSIKFLLFYSNFASVFFINLAVNALFKNEFYKLIKKYRCRRSST
jgi:hypothetical protein